MVKASSSWVPFVAKRPLIRLSDLDLLNPYSLKIIEFRRRFWILPKLAKTYSFFNSSICSLSAPLIPLYTHYYLQRLRGLLQKSPFSSQKLNEIGIRIRICIYGLIDFPISPLIWLPRTRIGGNGLQPLSALKPFNKLVGNVLMNV